MELNKYLITQDDIKRFRPTAELDDKRINPYILEAQILDLKPVLNDALFYDLLLKFDDSNDSSYEKYNELLNGKVYTYNAQTIFFAGVKAMLSYYALARFIVGNPVQITRMGVVTKINAQSEPASPQVINGAVNELRSAAITYQNEVIKFLENSTTDYPLYNTGGASENSARRTSFNFFKL